MEYEETDYPREDSLKNARYLIMDIFQIKLVKLLLVVALAFNAILFVVQTYLFLEKFDKYYFVLYAPLYFGTFFIIIALAAALSVTHLVPDGLKSLQVWKTDKINKNTAKRIQIESKLITNYLIATSILALISGLLHMFPTKTYKEIFFAYSIFERFVPTWQNELSWIYRTSFLLTSLTMPASCNQLVYATSHVRHQIYVLLHLTEGLNVERENERIDVLVDDREFQKNVKEKLIFIFCRHNKIYTVSSDVKDGIRIFIVLFAVAGGLLGISVLLFVFMQSLRSDFLHVGSLGMAGAATFVAVIAAGQEFENVGEEIFRVMTSLKWYRWNRENMKLYFILISSTLRPLQIDFTAEVAVNFVLGVKIAKMLYSMVSVLARFKGIRR